MDDICSSLCHVYRLIEVKAGDFLGISVKDETLRRREAAHRTPPGKSLAGTKINQTLW